MIATLHDAKQAVRVALRLGEERDCPCCTQRVAGYRYAINHQRAQQLLHLYTKGGWVKGTDLIFRHVGDYRKYSLLRFWELVETDGEGNYRITDLGRDFVEGQLQVRKYIVMFNNSLLDTEGEFVSFADCLGSRGALFETRAVSA